MKKTVKIIALAMALVLCTLALVSCSSFGSIKSNFEKNGYELKSKGNGWYGKGGMRGQMLTFNPERGVAVAWHSYEKAVPYDVMIHD